MALLSCSSKSGSETIEIKRPAVGDALSQSVLNQEALDKKIIGAWEMDLSSIKEANEEGGKTVKSIQKYAADKTFLFTIRSSVEGVGGYTQTGNWRIEGNKIILSPINASGKIETDEGHYDVIQIGENSMTVRNGKDVLVFIKVI